MACCEVPFCRHQFATSRGCDKHPYKDAYNLATKTNCENQSISEIIQTYISACPKTNSEQKTGTGGEK